MSGQRTRRRLRQVTAAAGVAMIGFGAWGILFHDPYLSGRQPGVLLTAAAVIVLHDGVWMPLVLLAGAAVARYLPEPVRAPVRTGLLVATAVTAVALPAALREDDRHGNSSLLPLPYRANLAAVLGAIALATVVAAALATGLAAGLKRRRRGRLTAAARGSSARRPSSRPRRAARRRWLGVPWRRRPGGPSGTAGRAGRGRPRSGR